MADMSSRCWKLSAALIAVVGLSACTTTEQANGALASRFKGSSTDSFFLTYGPPTSSFKLNDGGTLYSWQERAKTYHLAGSANTTVIGNQAFTTVNPGSTISVQCSIKIHADAGGKIADITVLQDSIGDWQMSRCNEVFARKV